MNTTHTLNPTHTKGYAVASGEGERIWIVGDTMTLKATGESTNGGLVLLDNLTAPGGGPPPGAVRFSSSVSVPPVLSPVALSVIVSPTIQRRSPSPAATTFPLVVMACVFMGRL